MAHERSVRENLDLLFMPRNLALIGATNNLGKWGGMILGNVLANGYKGRIFPVNPRDREIMAIPAYPAVEAISDEVDLACIVTPAVTVPQLLTECARKGVRTVLVISSDFAETGAEGCAREKTLREIAKRKGIRLVGPNSMGVFSAPVSLVCMMALVQPRKGDIAFASQSGNIGAQILEWGRALKAGFRYFVSSGNEADLSCKDYLKYFGEDPECRSVMLYLESLKQSDGWLETARSVSRRKPVVVFKGGKTPAGQRAAASHSAALAGIVPLYDASFRQCGLVQARTTEAFIDCGRSLSRLPLPGGHRVGIISRGGGWGVVTTDACEELGLAVPPLHPRTIEALDRFLPAYWSRGNPVDLVAMTDIRMYLECFELLMKDPNVDGVIALSALPGRVTSFFSRPDLKARVQLDDEKLRARELGAERAGQEVLEGILYWIKTLGKPVVLVGHKPPVYEDLLEREGLDVYPTPERAARVMARLMEYGKYRRRIESREVG
ncbi:MAG: CoA-binding protein [bacterium]